MVLSYLIVKAQTEVEPDDNYFISADVWTFSGPANYNMTPTGDKDIIQYTTTSAGVLEISCTNITNSMELEITIYNSSDTINNIGFRTLGPYGISNVSNYYQAVVPQGTYYVKINDRYNDEASASPYLLTVNFDTTDACEWNNTFLTACTISENTVMNATLYGKYEPLPVDLDRDYYQLTTSRDGVLEISCTNITNSMELEISIFNITDTINSIAYSNMPAYGISNVNDYYQAVLPQGSYYILINDLYDDEQSSTPYILTTHLDTSDACEWNNTFSTACTITEDTVMVATLYGKFEPLQVDLDRDYYQITTSHDGVLEISVTGITNTMELEISVFKTSDTLNNIGYSNLPAYTVSNVNDYWQAVIPQGSYYILINDLYDDEQSSTPYIITTHLDTTDVCEFNHTSQLACNAVLDSCFQEKIYGKNTEYAPYGNDQDWYVVQTTQWCLLTVSVNNPTSNLEIRTRFFTSANLLTPFIECNPCTHTLNNVCTTGAVAPGTYYIQISDCADDETSSTALSTCINAVITSVNEIENNNIFLIHPNPVKDRILVELLEPNHEQYSISLIDLLGETIYSQIVSNQSQISIDASNLSSGIYFLQIENGNTVGRRKFIKE